MTSNQASAVALRGKFAQKSILSAISGRDVSEFGTVRPRVQIPGPRPKSSLGFKESMQHPSLRRLLHAITGTDETAAVLDSNQSWPGFLPSGGGSRRPEAHGGGLVRGGWRHHATQRPSTVETALLVTRGTRGHPRRD